MALTSFPTITFNSSTGSDSAASGAGPATAVTGTCAASTNSTTVTFNASPDLSGVAQDGTAVLWVSGVGFNRISTVNNVAKTCVVENAITISAGTSFAIGGKRATLDDTESRRLFAATSTPTAVGATGQWTIQTETDQSISSVINLACTAGSGTITVRGDSTSTRRTITQTAAAAHFGANTANFWRFMYLVYLNSNASPGYAFTYSSWTEIGLESCIAGNNNGTNCPQGMATRTASTGTLSMWNCAVLRCTGAGINANGAMILNINGCDISRNGGGGISAANNNPVIVRNSIISYNSGDGINVGGSFSYPVLIDGNTIDGNTGDGIEIAIAKPVADVVITNNNVSNNGSAGSQYGINFSGTTPYHATVKYNNVYNNRTAAANGITLDATNLTTDPGYTDRTNTVRNYAVGAAVKAAGFPASTATIGAGQSGTTSYVDIGAAQRQEAGAGYARRPR